MKRTLRPFLALLLILTLLCSQALAAYETLEYGSRGSDVLKLQQTLKALGFDPNGVDGKYGRGTEKAVKRYQQSRGLTADGKAGNKTLTMLYNESAGGSAEDSNQSTQQPSTTNPNTLKYGDSGSRVTELQQNLKKLGYYTSSVDGRFGSGTQRAVVAFQKANGLTADGLAGTRTLNLIEEKATSASSNSGSSSSSGNSSSSAELTRTLRRGYTGADVTKVQNRLKELGYYTGEVDGVYGKGCIAAVKEFQKKHGLTADGLAGTRTFDKLFSSSALSAGSSSSGNSNSGSSSSGSSGYSTLRPGMTGEDVRNMQKALKNLGYPLSTDGSYGDETKEAVELFQRLNGLSADGLAGKKTLELLYSGNAKRYETSSSSGSSSNSSSGASALGSFTGKNGKTIQLLHWQNEIKPKLKTGQNLEVYEPNSGITFTLYVMSRGRHADVEPLTAEDTAKMMQAWDNKVTWTPKTVYVGLPDGRWTLAVMHNVAHGSQVISGNDFDGQNCVHFLRDMSEAEANDPDYGVTNQNALRKAWKALTGVVVN